jgi:hypothetical protein
MGIVSNLIKDETTKPFVELHEWAVSKVGTVDLSLLTFEAQGVFSDAQNVLGTLAEKAPVLPGFMGFQPHFGDSFHLSQVPTVAAISSESTSYGAVMAVPLMGYLKKAVSLFSELRADGHLSPMQAMKVLSTNLFKL